MMTRSLNAFGLVALSLILVVAGIFFLLKEDVPVLYINEIMANNLSCCPDRDGGRDEFDDWIEIYNPGSTPIDIGGMYLSQNKEEPLGYQIPSTNGALTTVLPGGHLVLWADGNPEQGILHLNFKLNHNGEYIGLFHQDGRTIDQLEFGRQNENNSYGRTSDGGNPWKVFAVPTPGKTNQ